MDVLIVYVLVCIVGYVASDPCVVEDTTWVEDDVIDILEDIPDYPACQQACARTDNAQCTFFTWYSNQHEESPLTCVFFRSTAEEVACEHCISGPAVCPTQDIILMGDSLLLELPSFTPANCTIASYPERGIQYAVGGTPGNYICGGRKADGSLLSSCYSLQGNTWQKEAKMAVARSGAAASSGVGGLMVSGGYGADGYLASTEIFKDGSWSAGPSLPAGVEGHCQVQIADDVFILGGYPGASPSAAAYVWSGVDEDSWAILGELRTPRGWHACSYIENELYVIGGYNGSYLSSTDVLDLDTGLWRAGPELPYPAYDGRALYYDGQLYLVGGYGSDGKIVRLSVDRNTWEEVAETADGTGARTWAPALVVSAARTGC